MSAPKNYTVRGMITKDDEAEIQEILVRHPLWKLKHARAQVAARKFARRIRQARSNEEEATHPKAPVQEARSAQAKQAAVEIQLQHGRAG